MKNNGKDKKNLKDDNDNKIYLIDDKVKGFYFEIITVLDRKVRTTEQYWQKIVDKHPPVKNLVVETKQTLRTPDEVRVSRKDESVYLYYKHYSNFILCVVVRHTNKEGFIITVYPTRNIKIGRVVWKKK